MVGVLILLLPKSGFSQKFPVNDSLNDSIQAGDSRVFKMSSLGSRSMFDAGGYITIIIDSIKAEDNYTRIYISEEYLFPDSTTIALWDKITYTQSDTSARWETHERNFAKYIFNSDANLIKKSTKSDQDSVLEWSFRDASGSSPAVVEDKKIFLKKYGLIYSNYSTNTGSPHSSGFFSLELIKFNGIDFDFKYYKGLFDISNGIRKERRIKSGTPSYAPPYDILGRKRVKIRNEIIKVFAR
jgi:hypothetical protein